MSMQVRTVASITDVPAESWDAHVGADNPFIEHRFLALLEETGCVGRRTAWRPRHLVAERGGRVVGVAPAYQRLDSMGEYVFDWGWADAAARAGIAYYPKLSCAVPFTPATGPRLVAADPQARAELGRALWSGVESDGLSSGHVLFCTEEDAQTLSADGWAERTGLQFHWRNDGYESFDAFLDKLRAEDRKQIRRERRRVVEAGLRVEVRSGHEVPRGLWPTIFALYTSIYDRKWGRPYLTRAFFERIPEVLGDRAVLGLAFRGDELVAMTLSFEKGRHLYGRSWGASVDVPGLHFELCYYALIERAIARGHTLFEAGAQGEHKLKRGFLPCLTRSMHRIADPRLAAAIGRFLTDEERAMRAEQAEMLAHSPFKEGAAPARPLVA